MYQIHIHLDGWMENWEEFLLWLQDSGALQLAFQVVSICVSVGIAISYGLLIGELLCFLAPKTWVQGIWIKLLPKFRTLLMKTWYWLITPHLLCSLGILVSTCDCCKECSDILQDSGLPVPFLPLPFLQVWSSSSSTQCTRMTLAQQSSWMIHPGKSHVITKHSAFKRRCKFIMSYQREPLSCPSTRYFQHCLGSLIFTWHRWKEGPETSADSSIHAAMLGNGHVPTANESSRVEVQLAV